MIRSLPNRVAGQEIDVNWEELLVPAPTGVAIISQLMMNANQVDDISINHKPGPLIKNPESFHASLIQISNDACNTFSKAHNNMDIIRIKMIKVPDDVQKCIAIIEKGNKSKLQKDVPSLLYNIQKTAKKGFQLAEEVANDFNQLMELIGQVLEATFATMSYRENQLDNKLVSNFLEKRRQNKIIKEQKQQLDELKHRRNVKEMEKEKLEAEKQTVQATMAQTQREMEASSGFIRAFFTLFGSNNQQDQINRCVIRLGEIDKTIAKIEEECKEIKNQYTLCFEKQVGNVSVELLKTIRFKQAKEELGKNHPIELLNEELLRLSQLKGQWAKMVQHFQSFSNVMTCTVQKLLTDFIKDAREAQMDKSQVQFMIESIQGSCQSSEFTHHIADLYFKISDRYIINNVDDMRRILTLEADQTGTQRAQKNLVASCEKASNDILAIFNANKLQAGNTIQSIENA